MLTLKKIMKRNCLSVIVWNFRHIVSEILKMIYNSNNLIKSNQKHSVEKLIAKELYLISLQHKIGTPASQKCFEIMFQDLIMQLKHIFTLSHITTTNSKL